MTPTLNDFTRALLTPDLSFATLADARAVTDRQGLPLLRRTTRFAEARIEWRGGSWLLFLPLALRRCCASSARRPVCAG